MILKINNQTYENVSWSITNNEGTARIPATENFNQLLTNFVQATEIEIYNDHDQLISIWYNKELISINKIGSEYVIVVNGNNLPQNTETNLMAAIEENEDAILELAALQSNVEQLLVETNLLTEQYHTRVENSISQYEYTKDQVDERLNRQSSINDTLTQSISDIRASLLSINNQIAMFPTNLNTRVIALENQFNALADRKDED